MVLTRATIRVKAETVAYQNTVIHRPAYGTAKRMRRDDAPYRLAAQLRLLVAGQRARQAAIQEGWQQTSTQETKV